MRKIMYGSICIFFLCFAGNATAGVQGYFVINAPTYIGGGTNPIPDPTYGVPDSNTIDLDGYGISVVFSDELTSFDYTTFIPEETDLIITCRGLVSDIEYVDVAFGYGAPIDTDGDGDAENISGTPEYIGSVLVEDSWWSQYSDPNLRKAPLHFFDLDSDINFTGFSNDFFVTVDDNFDFDIDAIQIVTNIENTPVPAPAALWLLGSGLLGLAGIRRKSRP